MRYFVSLIVCVSLFIADLSQAQTYHGFPADSAFWKYFGHDNAYYFKNYKSIELDGDTVIASKLYRRLFETNQNTITIIDSTIFYPPHFMGGLREENKIAFFYDPVQLEEDTIFNFNLSVGDTAAFAYSPIIGDGFYVTISTIDSVQMLDGTFRTRFNFSSPFGGSYIDEIGSVGGIFPEYVPVAVGPGAVSYELTCFEENGNQLYHESATEDCSIITSVSVVTNSNDVLKISPNPFSNEAVVEFGKMIHEGVLEIRTLSGQIVFSESIINSNEEKVSSEKLNVNGIYFMILKSGNEVYCSKLIYQN